MKKTFEIHPDERKKVLILSCLKVCVVVNFWLVHNLKDIAVMTAPGSGAECINYLKIIVFFATLGFVASYSSLAKKYTQRVIVQRMLMVFVALMLLFAVSIPHYYMLQAGPETILRWQTSLSSLRWVAPVVGYWVFSLFFITAEMWSMVCMSILFWQFVNTMFSVSQSKRFYSIFGFVNGITTVLMGCMFSGLAHFMKGSANPFDTYTKFMGWGAFAVACVCVVMMRCYNYIYSMDFQHRAEQEQKFIEGFAASKGIWRPIKKILSSWYLGLIFLLGLSYNCAHTLVDVTWKQQVKAYCQTSLEVQRFLGDFTAQMGYGILLGAALNSVLVRRIGWYASALLTPVLLLLTGAVFLGSVAMRGVESLGIFATLGFSVYFGRWHEVIARSMKHSVFNITREMVYVPLDYQMQVHGKAVADVLGGRVGKMLGALLPGFLLMVHTSFNQGDLVPFISLVFCAIILLWICAVFALNRRFNALVKESA